MNRHHVTTALFFALFLAAGCVPPYSTPPPSMPPSSCRAPKFTLLEPREWHVITEMRTDGTGRMILRNRSTRTEMMVIVSHDNSTTLKGFLRGYIGSVDNVKERHVHGRDGRTFAYNASPDQWDAAMRLNAHPEKLVVMHGDWPPEHNERMQMQFGMMLNTMEIEL